MQTPPISSSYRRESGTPVSDPGPILRHRSGPSSQLSGPIAGSLACVEDARRLRLPSAPSPGGGLPVCTGPDFKKEKIKIQQKDFFLCLFSSLTLETTKTLVYALSAASMEELMSPSIRRFVAYYRVSTARQGRSGLGLEAQKAAVLAFINGHAELVAEFTEVESGKHANREELKKAIAACKKHKAKLVIAKLDRLSRNLAFI